MTTSVDFTHEALGKVGIPYSGATPTAFDTSGLVVEAAKIVGVTLPETSTEIYALCRSKGTILDVDIAEYIRGALLFENAVDNPRIGISLGNGEVIEAHSSSYDVVDFDAPGRRWHTAALIPGLVY